MTLSASQHVVLEVYGGTNQDCSDGNLDFIRNLPNGEREAGPGGLGWRVPAGQALVVTDVDWQYVHPDGAAAADTIQILRLFVTGTGPSSGSDRQFESTITLSAKGEGGISEAMTTGFVVSSGAVICPDVFPGPTGPPSGLQHMIVRGYLIADV